MQAAPDNPASTHGTGVSLLRVAAAGAAVALLPIGAAAGAHGATCPGSGWQIEVAEPEDAAAICAGVQVAAAFLSSCGVAVASDMRIRVLDELPQYCGAPAYGSFDPVAGEIVLGSVAACIAEPALMPDLFSLLPADAAHQSVAAHEAAHAMLHAAGLGLERRIEQEFLASVAQFAGLETEHRAALMEAFGIQPPVHPGIFNDFILAMDPLAFGALAWTSFEAAPDGCALVRGLIDGTIRLGDLPP